MPMNFFMKNFKVLYITSIAKNYCVRIVFGKDKANQGIGKLGIGTRNERGEILLDFTTANKLYNKLLLCPTYPHIVGSENHRGRL